jgi:hypothetical protein
MTVDPESHEGEQRHISNKPDYLESTTCFWIPRKKAKTIGIANPRKVVASNQNKTCARWHDSFPPLAYRSDGVLRETPQKGEPP